MTSDAASDQHIELRPLELPRLTANAVPRPRLMARLDQLASLTVIEALPGYGKTTLAAAWADSRRALGDAVAWVTATDGMDLNRLIEAVWDALSAAGVVRKFVPEFVTARRRQVLIAELNSFTDARIIIVLDDLEVAAETTVLARISRFLRACPNVHTVAIVRAGHSSENTSLGRAPDLNAVWGSDLLISETELTAFAAVWGHELDAGRAHTLRRLTGGWPRLARLLLDHSNGETGDFNLVPAADYLSSVVSRTLPPNLFSQTQILALLDTFDRKEVEVAVVLAGPSETSWPPDELAREAATFIRQLASAGLITPVEPRGVGQRWMFSGVPAWGLRRSYDDQKSVAARSARAAYARRIFDSGDKSRMIEMLRLARDGHDWELLSRIWSRHMFRLTVDYADSAILTFAALPPEAIAQFPVLSAAAATAHGVDSAGGPLAMMGIDAAAERIAGLSIEDMDTSDDVLGAITSAMIAYRGQGRHRRAIELVGRARDELARRGREGMNPPSRLPLAWYLYQSSLTLLLMGREPLAIAFAKQALDASSSDEEDFIRVGAAAQLILVHTRRGIATDGVQGWRRLYASRDISRYWFTPWVRLPANIAEIWHATDKLDEAASTAAITKLPLDGYPFTELWAYALEARVRHALTFGDPHRAWTELTQARAMNHTQIEGGTVAARILNRYSIDTLLATGQLNQAQNLIDTHRFSPNEPDPRWLQVPHARLWLIAGHYARARTLAASAMWRDDVTPRDRIELGLIVASATLHEGEIADAAKAFATAHSLAERHGLAQPFASIPTEDLAVLHACLRLPAIPAAIYPSSATLIQLTAREREILAELVIHETVGQIAQQVSVSPNTVKKQVGSIYAKLGAHNRTAALAAAKRLGLLTK